MDIQQNLKRGKGCRGHWKLRSYMDLAARYFGRISIARYWFKTYTHLRRCMDKRIQPKLHAKVYLRV